MAIIFYLLAVVFWALLLHPYFYTLFTAACFACFSLPLYNRLVVYKPGLWAISIYTVILSLIMMIPIAVVGLLVTPQALAGYATLQRLRAANFQLPQNWIANIEALKQKFMIIPGLEGWVNDFSNNLETMLSGMVKTLVSGGVGVLGGTMTVLWVIFLFVTFSVLGVVYAERFRRIVTVLTHIPDTILDRFICSIRGALRGVFLGVLLVALAQGLLCGVGFAVAGVAQPAFWGLLATFVAPIPVIGTALVWIPLCIVLWFSDSTVASIGLAIWGMVAVAGADNIIRPIFLKRGINAPLFVLLLSILCGLATFGPVGLIIGPVIVAFGVQAVKEADELLLTNSQ